MKGNAKICKTCRFEPLFGELRCNAQDHLWLDKKCSATDPRGGDEVKGKEDKGGEKRGE